MNTSQSTGEAGGEKCPLQEADENSRTMALARDLTRMMFSVLRGANVRPTTDTTGGAGGSVDSNSDF